MTKRSGSVHSVAITLDVDVDGQRRAALTVVSHALDLEDGRMLLDMLGLVPDVESPDRDAAVVP